MAIVIKGKGLPFCTKAGNSPYNNNGVLAWVPPDRIVDEYAYREARLVVLRPVIDKLVFEYNFSEFRSQKQPAQEAVLEKVNTAAKKNEMPLSAATKETVGWKRLNELRKQYKHNFVLLYEPTGAKIIMQLEPHKKSRAYLRCDLNPARLGAEGMTFFRERLNVLLLNEQKPVTFETIAKKQKAIKRIDIAVDMLGVDVADIEDTYIFKKKVLKKKTVNNPTGRVETKYFKMPENDKNQAYCYNKKQDLKEKAKDLLDGGQTSPYGQALYTRVEYRINETDKPIANLKSLANHLTKLDLRAVDYSLIADKDFTHILFLRYALGRTKDKALELIPDDLKDSYAASYDKAIVDIWEPEDIWEKGWPKELLYVGLTSPEELKKMKGKKK